MLADRHGNASIEVECGLAEEIVRTFGELRLRVYGTSMVPSILPGDLVFIHRAALADISSGEIVLFQQAGRFFVHRVVDRKAIATTGVHEESCLITRGDRLRQNDPPVSSSELLGRLVSIERDKRKIALPANGSNRMVARLLQSSDRATYLYLRLAEYWRTLFLRRAKCLV
jgi:signal peptidase I